MSNYKFGRSFSFTCTSPDGQIVTLTDPLTLEFRITRKFLASVNTGTFKILNLGLKTRNLIYKDQFMSLLFLPVQLKAGYGTNQAVIFNGNIVDASSFRESGSNNFTTVVTGYDGGFATVNSEFKATYKTGESRDKILTDLAVNMASAGGLQIGKVSPIWGATAIARGRALAGKTWDLLQVESGNRAYIDNGRLYVLNDGEFSSDETIVVSNATGLLGSPKRFETQMTVDILFEPRIQIAQKVQLISLDNPNYSGDWQVRGVTHSGTISGAVCGEVRTTLDLLYTSNLLAAAA